MLSERFNATRKVLKTARAEGAGITYGLNVSGLPFPYDQPCTIVIDPEAELKPGSPVAVFADDGFEVTVLESFEDDDLVLRAYDEDAPMEPKLFSVAVPFECYAVTNSAVR